MRPSILQKRRRNLLCDLLLHFGQPSGVLPETEAAVPVGTIKALTALINSRAAARTDTNLILLRPFLLRKWVALHLQGTIFVCKLTDHPADISHKCVSCKLTSLDTHQRIFPVGSQLRRFHFFRKEPCHSHTVCRGYELLAFSLQISIGNQLFYHGSASGRCA